MADINPLRAMLVVIGFLALVVLLIGQIPSNFFTATGLRADIDYSDLRWEGIDLQSFAETWNHTDDLNVYEEQFDIGGRNLEWDSHYSNNYLLLSHRYGIGLIFTERGEWFDRNGVKVSAYSIYGERITITELDAEYTSYGDLQFRVYFDSEAVFNVWTHIDFNETTYSSPSDAWDNDDLSVLVGIGFDEVNTTFNAWDLVGMILFFQLPDLGLSILGVIIALPLWVSIAVIAFYLITRAIPLLGG